MNKFKLNGIKNKNRDCGFSLTPLIILLLICTLCSCQAGENKKREGSYGSYPQISDLTSEQISDYKLSAWTNADNPYIPYSTHVSIEKDELKLTVLKYYDSPKSHAVGVNYGFFVGTDYGEFGGFLKFYEDMDSEGTVFSEDNCYGIVKINNNLCYLISGKWNMKTAGVSSVYKLSVKKNSDEWVTEKIADLDGSTLAYTYSKNENCIYIATWKSLVRLSLSDSKATTLLSPDYWDLLGVNSIENIDGSLYMGTRMGVLEYKSDTGDSIWYPIDYEKYLSE